MRLYYSAKKGTGDELFLLHHSSLLLLLLLFLLQTRREEKTRLEYGERRGGRGRVSLTPRTKGERKRKGGGNPVRPSGESKNKKIRNLKFFYTYDLKKKDSCIFWSPLLSRWTSQKKWSTFINSWQLSIFLEILRASQRRLAEREKEREREIYGLDKSASSSSSALETFPSPPSPPPPPP